jgi:hypothetical protein
MIPIVASLLSYGLSILGNAVLAKGKEAVQEKLGVNIDDMMGTENGRIELAKLQAQNEQVLLSMAIQQREQDLRQEAMGYADTASARDMNTRVNESVSASPLSKNIVPILALLIVLAGLAILVWSPYPDVRTAIVGIMMLPLSFFFGTTAGSARKDATIAKLTEGGAP